jgi:MFS family permease
MAVLFLIVFVDLVGFGLLIPLLPFYVQRVGAGPDLITIVLGLYSLAQFVAGPVWGRLSDRFGRKPILVLTSGGLAASYVMLALAHSLGGLVVARLFGGLMGGNIGAAQAYISDITTPATRSKGMGLIGAAFGLGFIFGPAIGGLLGGTDVATADFFLPAMTAAAITLVAAIGAVVLLKESLTPELRAAASRNRLPLAARLRASFLQAALLALMMAGFLAITGWAQLESIFSLWANARFGYGPRQIGLLLGFVGIVAVIIQGGAIGALTRKFGERALLIGGLGLMVAGYVALAFAGALVTLLFALAALAVASGLFNPSITSLISQEAAPHERGAVLGTYQGATALSRVIGPMFSGTLFTTFGIGAPYFTGAALAGIALIWVLAMRRAAASRD